MRLVELREQWRGKDILFNWVPFEDLGNSEWTLWTQAHLGEIKTF